MTPVLALLAAGSLLFVRASGAAELKGCATPQALGSSLARLASTEWGSMSLNDLEILWSDSLAILELTESKVGPDGPISQVRIVGHRRRVIEDGCECCKMLELHGSRGEGEEHRARLGAVTVTYSARRLEDAVRSAELLTERIGRGLMVFSRWDRVALRKDRVVTKEAVRPVPGRESQTELIRVRLSAQGEVWMAHLHWSRDQSGFTGTVK